MNDDLVDRDKFLEDIIEGLPGGVFQFHAYDDGAMRLTYRSRRAYELAHLPPDWHLGINAHPEDRERLIASVYEAVAAASPWSFEGRYINASGEVRWMKGWALPIKRDGEVLYNGLLLDITHRKRTEESLLESEERFRNAFDGAAIGMALVSPEGRFMKVNQSLCEMLGYSEEELLRSTFQEITHPDDIDASLNYYQQARAGEIQAYHIEKRYLTKSGEVVWVMLAVSVVRDGAGNPMYGVSQFQDITERKRAEEEKQHFYRDTIKSATQGKLDLVTFEEVKPYLDEAELTIDIRFPADTTAARHSIRHLCSDRGIRGDGLEFFEVAAGEAMANAVRHADEGHVYAGALSGTVWVAVADEGPGIPALTLPRATLHAGFSTKVSMGIGYTVMMEASDRVLLCTGPQGTTVVLIKDIAAPERALSLEDLPDAWDQ